MARTCPECGSDLTAEEILGITLDVCPDCAGIWFDDGELLKLKELGDDAIDEVEGEAAPAESAPKKESSRMCPDCGVCLEEFSYLYTTNVQLDSCSRCYGTWIQDGELQAMRVALEEARTSPENRHMMRTIEHHLDVIDGDPVQQETLDRHQRVVRFLRVFSLRRSSVG